MTDVPNQTNEYDGPIPPAYAQVRYAARDTPGVVWYDPRDGRETIRIDHDESEIEASQRRLVAAKITPHQPAEFDTPAEQYLTELVFETRKTHDSGTSARREVHNLLVAAQAHLGEHAPGYDDAPRRDAVRHHRLRRHYPRQRERRPAMSDDRADDYDPFEHVPERISALTASGLAWLDDQLYEENKALLRSLPIERQARVLAELIETGAIGVRPETVRDLLNTGAIRASDEDSDPRGGRPMSRQPYPTSGPARCARCGRERGKLRVVDGRHYCRGCLL